MNGKPVSKHDELRYGPLGSSCVHLCVDMQRLFAEPTEWQMPWLEKVLPTIVELRGPSSANTLYPLHPRARAGTGCRHVGPLLRTVGIDDD